jgi:pimeloyl-ACP methyl ester carboxylesterase
MSTDPPAADRRIAYGASPEQFGDLRLPNRPGPHPVVVAIHGGNWRAQYDLSHLGHFCAALTAAGLATWSVEYRRIGQVGGGWPGTFQDVGSAADYLRDLAPRYELDLTLWLVGRSRIPRGDPLWSPDPIAVRGVVSLAGVGDLRRRWELQGTASMVPALMGASPTVESARYRSADAAQLLPTGVRQVLIQGTFDDNVPYVLAEEYRDRAVVSGDAVTLIGLPGVGHFELIDPLSPEFEVVVRAIVELLER